jgi:hypothetical protein
MNNEQRARIISVLAFFTIFKKNVDGCNLWVYHIFNYKGSCIISKVTGKFYL